MKINPLYVALLLIATLIFTIYQLDQSRTELRESKKALVKVETMAEEIDALKRAWDNPKTTGTALERLLKAPQLKSANIQQTTKRSLIILKSNKADLKATNYFFVKLFNGAFIIEKFDIKRLDDISLSFQVEIHS
ncbi:MAG: hypothetical protein PF439_11270 [Helicobacteraceae bacterium]|jgi:hypothetical protein|nr:hypothetical protein [Helicobacteraceae bacterium]